MSNYDQLLDMWKKMFLEVPWKYYDQTKSHSGVNATNFRILSLCLIIVNGRQTFARLWWIQILFLLQGMHGLATLFVCVLWRIGVTPNNGWWRELLH
jgi:hypothetical protein